MKKVITAIFMIALCLSGNLPVFSQKMGKISNSRVNNIFAPTNVNLEYAAGFSDGKGVYLQWQAESETNNVGFYIYRIGKNGRELVTPSIVGGGFLRAGNEVVYGQKYSYFDVPGDLRNSYYIESLSTDGQRQILKEVFPKYVDDLTPFAGYSSEQLRRRAETATPFVEESPMNLPKDLSAQMEENSLPPNPVGQRWVAAQPGVKINVKQEGIFRVSRSELQTAGFDVNAPGNLWQLYVDGNEQAINVAANDSYIEFYGKGIDTLESAAKVYYLIVGPQDGKRIGVTTIRRLSGNVEAKSYNQTFTRKERSLYIGFGILNGEAENFFGDVAISGSPVNPPPITTLTFNLTGVDFSTANCRFEFGVQSITDGSHQIRATLNGVPMTPINGFGKVLMNGNFDIPTSTLREGTNTLQLQAFGGSTDINVAESIRVTYWRKYEAVQNRLSLYTHNYRTSTLSGFTSPNIRVFDLTYPDTLTRVDNLRIDNNNGNYSVNFPSNRGRVIYAVEDSAILAADSISLNNPSTLTTPARNGEMIIVTHRNWLTQANDWANYRRGLGMSVEVVDVEDIFDEYSYGSQSTSAMTNFFSYAKNNWQTSPNYILLMGDATFDFKNFENRPFLSYVPTKLVDTFYEETGSDEALCDFNADGLAEIAVGRIPARNPQTVTQLLTKTMVFEASLTNVFSRGALFASDSATDFNFPAMSQRLADQLPPTIPKTFIKRDDPDAHNVLIGDLNTGRYLVNYAGHGTIGIWAHVNFFSRTDAFQLNNGNNLTIFNMLTCLNGYFLNTDDNLAEMTLKAPNGGAVATWASTGKTTTDFQEVLATRFYNQIGNGTMNRMGDLIKDAKQVVNGGRDVRLSWNLLGDPALKVK